MPDRRYLRDRLERHTPRDGCRRDRFGENGKSLAVDSTLGGRARSGRPDVYESADLTSVTVANHAS